jgi:hypothetical protein
MSKNKVTLLAVVVTLALVNVGCKKSSGGGFIDSVVDGGKASLGYQMKCDNFLDEASGEFIGHVTGNVQFNDHDADVKIHGKLDFVPFFEDEQLTSCETIAAIIDDELPDDIDAAFAVGTYNHKGQSGEVFIAPVVDDNCPTGEAFVIEIEGDISYSNGGCLRGGNLTIF